MTFAEEEAWEAVRGIVAQYLGISTDDIQENTLLPEEKAVEIFERAATAVDSASLAEGWPKSQPLTYGGLVGLLRYGQAVALGITTT